MADTQPLLNTFTPLSTDKKEDDSENKNNTWKQRFTTWCECFNRTKKKDQYTELDDNYEKTAEEESVGVFQLFRFATRLDLFLMIISIIMIWVDIGCNLVIIILVGEITALFATTTFNDQCNDLYRNSTLSNMNNHTFVEGNRVDNFNLLLLNKLPYNTDNISSPNLTIFTNSFREEFMGKVYGLIILGCIEFVTAGSAHYSWHYSLKRQIFHMKAAFFRSIVQRNISYMDTTSSTQLSAKLFGNIDKVEKGLGIEFLMLISSSFSIVVAIIVSLVINWQLALIILCFFPIALGVTYFIAHIEANESINDLNGYAKAGQIVQEVFSSIRTVLSFNGGAFEQKRYISELHSTREHAIRLGAVIGVFMGWFTLMSYLVYSLGFIFGSLLIPNGAHQTKYISGMITVVLMFAQFIGFFGMLGPFFQGFSEAKGAATEVFRLIDEGNDETINETDVWENDEQFIDNLNGDIEFHNVNFSYSTRKEVEVLRNLSLVARVGQTTALVGSSGCGKSTCMSLCLRYYEPSSGRITIDGESITKYNLKTLRKRFGVVSQEPILFDLTIYENIRLGKTDATREEIEEAAKQANAHNFIMKLPNKYETLIGERGVQLSGGERQRIALARAVVKQPKILLLDEATSALDNVNEKIVQEAISRASKGRTSIIIAHRLSTIQNADQIYVLENGSIVEQGTHSTLMAKDGGKYQTMVKRQQMERMEDDIDDTMNVEQEEEDENMIGERSYLRHDSQIVDSQKQTTELSKRQLPFFRLLSMNRPEWIILLIGCIGSLITGGSEPVSALLLATIIEAFKYCSHSERQKHVLLNCLFMLLLGLFILLVRCVQCTAFAAAGSRLVQRFRKKAFSCLLRQEVAYFDRPENSSGAICARLASDAIAIQELAGTRLGLMIEVFALSLFGFIIGCVINWQLAFLALAAFVIVVILVSIEFRANIWLQKKSNPIIGEASMFSIEVFQNLRTVKQLSIESEVFLRHKDLLNQIKTLSQWPQILSALSYSTFLAVEAFILAFIYWRARILYENHEISSKKVILASGFALYLLMSLMLIANLSRHLAASYTAVTNFFDLFDRKPTIDNGSTKGQELSDFRGEITFDQVNFAYPTRPTSMILKKFQLNVKPSQRVALVGSSGCGKSTIIQLLERFYDVTNGHLYVDGIDIRKLNLRWLRSQIGLVSQEPILFDLTIAENIAYGLENVRMVDIIDAAKKANIHQFVDRLPEGYGTRVGEKGSFLSGGEKQRIAIARVLIRRPKLLLLDEATSAMDSENEQIVQVTLEQAQIEDPNRTSLTIAHRLSTVSSCDLICVVDNGHIIERGTHEALVQRRGAYYKMLSQNNS